MTRKEAIETVVDSVYGNYVFEKDAQELADAMALLTNDNGWRVQEVVGQFSSSYRIVHTTYGWR